MTGTKKGVWIAWESHRRNKGLSHSLGFNLYEIDIHLPRLIRYGVSMAKTIVILVRERPHVVIAQNPSLILGVVILLLRPFFGYLPVIDAHNAGIRPIEGRVRLLMWVALWVQRKAALTLVTNPEMKSSVDQCGGRAFVIPDRLPSASPVESDHLAGRVKVAYICTFGLDEPYRQVIEAARLLADDIIVHVTGDCSRVELKYPLPSNVIFTGYLPENEYWSLLKSADIIMDLTTREGCLVCGAYEGLALSKVLVLSDKKALRSYFRKGCVYVDSNSESIAQGIERAINEYDSLTSEIQVLKHELGLEWEKRLKALSVLLGRLH
jgi:glycosyltransferase involved in cell wall biosynthesis